MRDFFIRGFEVVLGILIVLAAIAIVVMAGFAAFSDIPVAGTPGGVQGPVAGLMILVGGFLALLVYGGIAYLGLGIYHNTRRAAEALEARGGRV